MPKTARLRTTRRTPPPQRDRPPTLMIGAMRWMSRPSVRSMILGGVLVERSWPCGANQLCAAACGGTRLLDRIFAVSSLMYAMARSSCVALR